MIQFLLLLVSLRFTSSEISVCLIISELTPPMETIQLLSNINGIENYVGNTIENSEEIIISLETVSTVAIPYLFPQVCIDRNAQIILDSSNDLTYSQFIAEKAVSLDILHVVIDRSIEVYAGELN